MSAVPQSDALALDAMRIADLGAVLAIEQAAYEFPWTRGNFVDSLAAGYDASVLRARDGALRAYAIVLPGVEESHLLNLTVAPAWQGQGLARRLLDTLVARCRERGDACLWLEVRPSNERARRIYARYGFVEAGLRRGYYPARGGAREDALVLKLTLAQGPVHALD